MTTIALADDHAVMRRGLAALLAGLGYHIIFEAGNGKEFKECCSTKGLPQVAILDINMPLMNGYETAAWLKETHPEVQVLALSMYDNDAAIVRMIKAGARGYILKDSDIADVKKAIDEVVLKGYYHSDLVTAKLIRSLHLSDGNKSNNAQQFAQLNNRELEFLKLACAELSYKEIADRMYVSPRTVEGYRDALFEKLEVRSRVGLVLFAIKNGIVQI